MISSAHNMMSNHSNKDSNKDFNEFFLSTYNNQQKSTERNDSAALSFSMPAGAAASAWGNSWMNPGTGISASLLTALQQQPNDHDVVCGSRKTYQFHPGNVFFMNLIKPKMDIYSAASRIERSVLISRIVEEIKARSPTGTGFVQKELLSGKFLPVDDHVAREKISQAFRDLLHKQYRSSSKARHEHRIAERKRTRFFPSTNSDHATQEIKPDHQESGKIQRKPALLRKSDSISSWSSDPETFDGNAGEIASSNIDGATTTYFKTKHGSRQKPHTVSSSSSSGASVTENTISKMNPSLTRNTSKSSYDSFNEGSNSGLSQLSETSVCEETTQPDYLVSAARGSDRIRQEAQQEATSLIVNPTQTNSSNTATKNNSSSDFILKKTTQEERNDRKNIPTASFLCEAFQRTKSW